MRINFLYALLHMIGRFLLKMLFRLEVEGQKNIPPKGGIIFAANHSSFLDPIMVAEASYRQLFFLAKKDLFKGGVFPKFIGALNALPLEKNFLYPSTLKKIREILHKGGALLLFPEGTRSANGKIRKGKTGVGFLSLNTCTPVIPTLILGTEKALPPGKKMISPVKVKVKFGPPLYPPPSSARLKKDYYLFTEKIMEEILKLKKEEEKQYL